MSRLNASYLRRDGRLGEALASFDEQLPQIRQVYSWARQSAATDPQAAAVCLAFPLAGEGILEFRQPLAERAEWLEAALAIPAGFADRDVRIRLLASLGATRLDRGEIAAAVSCQEDRLRLSRETGEWRLESAALSGLGYAYNALGSSRRALDTFGRRLWLARRHGDLAEEARALGDLAGIELGLGRLRPCIAHDEQRLRLAREVGDWSQQGYALSHLFAAHYRLGNMRRSRELAEQQLEVARRHGDRGLEGYALGNLGAVAIRQRQLGRAEELYEQRLANARRIGDRQEEGFALGDLGSLHVIQGELERARGCFQTRLEHAVRNGLNQEQGYALGNLGSLCEDRGDWDGARGFYLRRWENANLTQMDEEKLFSAGNLGTLELVAGRYGPALEWYRTKLSLSREATNRDLEAQGLTSLSITCLLCGARAEARAHLGEARSIYRELSRALPIRFRFCMALLACPPFLVPAAFALTKRLRSWLLRRGLRYRIEYLRQ